MVFTGQQLIFSKLPDHIGTDDRLFVDLVLFRWPSWSDFYRLCLTESAPETLRRSVKDRAATRLLLFDELDLPSSTAPKILFEQDSLGHFAGFGSFDDV